MNEPGKTVILDNGKRGVLSSGKSAVFNADGECASCCGQPAPPCEPHVVASRAVYPGGGLSTVWDISEYQAPGVFTATSRWRLILYIPTLSIYCVVAAEGDVDASGMAINLPKSIDTYYGAGAGDMYELQQGCLPNDFTHQLCSSYEYEGPDQYIILEY